MGEGWHRPLANSLISVIITWALASQAADPKQKINFLFKPGLRMKFEVLSIRTSHLWLLPWPALLIMSSAALVLSYSIPQAQGMKPWISAAAKSLDVVVILSSYRFITRYPCCLWKFILIFLLLFSMVTSPNFSENILYLQRIIIGSVHLQHSSSCVCPGHG